LKDSYDRVEKLSDLKEIKICKWTKNCWKCKKERPVVSYYFAYFPNYHIGDIEKLGKILMKEYSFEDYKYSRTQSKTVIAKIYVHCSVLQGNYYLFEDIIELIYYDFEKYIDKAIPNVLNEKDFNFED